MPVGVQSLFLSIYSEITLGMSEDRTWEVACIAKPYMLYYSPALIWNQCIIFAK